MNLMLIILGSYVLIHALIGIAFVATWFEIKHGRGEFARFGEYGQHYYRLHRLWLIFLLAPLALWFILTDDKDRFDRLFKRRNKT